MRSRAKQLTSLAAVLLLCLGLAAMPSFGRSKKSKKKSSETTSTSQTAKKTSRRSKKSAATAEASQPGASAAHSSEASSRQPSGSDMVWVNTSSKVFHVKGDRYYGKTKSGKYMTEAEAVKEGYHEARHGGRSKSSK